MMSALTLSLLRRSPISVLLLVVLLLLATLLPQVNALTIPVGKRAVTKRDVQVSGEAAAQGMEGIDLNDPRQSRDLGEQVRAQMKLAKDGKDLSVCWENCQNAMPYVITSAPWAKSGESPQVLTRNCKYQPYLDYMTRCLSVECQAGSDHAYGVWYAHLACSKAGVKDVNITMAGTV